MGLGTVPPNPSRAKSRHLLIKGSCSVSSFTFFLYIYTMTSRLSLSDILNEFRTELRGMYPENEIRNIGYLVAEQLLNYSKIDFHLKDKDPISPELSEKFRKTLTRLKNWEPIQYILGTTEFYGLPFRVDRRVLIPRPETEELAEWIIRENSGKPVQILDIGTGSGCIAVTLAKNLAEAKVSACDISEDALALANINAEINHSPVRFFRMDMLNGSVQLPEKVDLIVSNPPYVKAEEKSLMRRNVLDFEPGNALFVQNENPLVFYRSIALMGRKFLKDGGKLYLEINEQYPAEISRLLENTGYYGIVVRNDLSGKPRMIRGMK
jgi:release factor glutamine methyltransferase